MGMHNFGQKRWGSGIMDDIRSHGDVNTRVIGDFTKSVVLLNIVQRMGQKLREDFNWKTRIERLPLSIAKERLTTLHQGLVDSIEHLASKKFVRKRLQTRFFELGNNFYLGMELPREFELFKGTASAELVPPRPPTAPDQTIDGRKQLVKALQKNLDLLWYESCLEIIAEGDGTFEP